MILARSLRTARRVVASEARFDRSCRLLSSCRINYKFCGGDGLRFYSSSKDTKLDNPADQTVDFGAYLRGRSMSAPAPDNVPVRKPTAFEKRLLVLDQLYYKSSAEVPELVRVHILTKVKRRMFAAFMTVVAVIVFIAKYFYDSYKSVEHSHDLVDELEGIKHR